MVSRATSAAKAASRVAYIARLKVVPFPPEIVGEFFVSGKILRKMQEIRGRARLQPCDKVFAIDTEFGEGTTGKRALCTCPHTAGILDPEFGDSTTWKCAPLRVPTHCRILNQKFWG
jgi:hypothetical protein